VQNIVSRASAGLFAQVVCFLAAGCSQGAVAVEYRPGYEFSRVERRTIERIANAAAREARQHLPALPTRLRLTVQVGSRVIPETGDTATTGQPAAIYWTVNSAHAGGVLAVTNQQLRATLFHEFYHLVREATITPDSLIERMVSEGLATAFEREFGGAPTPWGAYPDDVAVWTQEFMALPPDADERQWMYQHSDGRRWIGFKVGTYVADRAARAAGLPVSQLATVPAERITAWVIPN
jgi:uncharacterized protein YjaZ